MLQYLSVAVLHRVCKKMTGLASSKQEQFAVWCVDWGFHGDALLVNTACVVYLKVIDARCCYHNKMDVLLIIVIGH